MNQLCVIPTCRLRGRHLPACQDESCGGCLPRVADEGLTCDVCLGRTRDRLAAIAQLAPDARLVAMGQVKRGSGGASGKPGSQSPGDDGAMDALAEVQNTLATWVRHICEERGLDLP